MSSKWNNFINSFADRSSFSKLNELSTGVLYGGTITSDYTINKVDIEAGVGQLLIKEDNCEYLRQFSWGTIINYEITDVGSYEYTVIYVDRFGTIRQRKTLLTDEELESNILLGIVFHIDNIKVNQIINQKTVPLDTPGRVITFLRKLGLMRVDGLSIEPNTGLKVDRSEGTIFGLGVNYYSGSTNVDELYLSGQTFCNIVYVYKDGLGGFTYDNNGGSFYIVVDPNFYDDGSGTLQPVPGPRWSIQRCYLFPENPSEVVIYYSQYVYGSYDLARASLEFEVFDEDEISKRNAVFLGYIIVRNGALDLSDPNDCKILQSGFIRNLPIGGGGSGGSFSGSTIDTFVTGFTYNPLNNEFTISRNQGQPNLTATINSVNGLTVNGNLDVTGVTTVDILNISGTTDFNNNSISNVNNLQVTTINSNTPVYTTRNISTTAPLSGGGNLSADRTLSITQASASVDGYLSSGDWTTFNGKQNALGYTPVTNARTLTINGTAQDLTADRSWSVGTVTSVGLSMPAAFTVSSSPITSSGSINVTGAGLTSQYVRGDGSLANFVTNVGGGSSVSYYLNGSVNQGVFGGNTYYELSKIPNTGAAADFTISTNGYIANFITSAGDPSLLSIPAGNWDFQIYFSASSFSGSPQFYTELYKYDGATFTLISSGSISPQNITNGTFSDLYVSNLSVSATTLTVTDRLAIRIYVLNSSQTITMYTQNNKLAEVHTTFSTGLAALNGLTTQIQNFGTGTSGTDFNISSSTATHTFNIPTASALNRGLLSSTDWTTFNGKVSGTRSISTSSPLSGGGDLSADRTISIQDAAADGTTKGAATFTASDFDSSSGLISIDYTNGQSASGSNKGFLTSSDWTTFNGKVSGTRNITVNGTTQDLSADRTFTVTDANLSMSDITTNNVSTTQHGFVPKAPNNTSQFLRGDGTWAAPTAVDPEGWTVIVKSANQDVTNNATLQDDTELQFSVVAGGHYMVSCNITTSGNNSTGDYKWGFAVSSGTMKGYGTIQSIGTTSAVQNVIVTANSSAVTTAIAIGAETDIDFLVHSNISFSFTASANAVFKFQFSNNTAGAGRISRTWKGSILRYKRID